MTDRRLGLRNPPPTVFDELLKRLEHQPRIPAVTRLGPISEQEFRETYAAMGYPVILPDLIPLRLTSKEDTAGLLQLAMGSDHVTVRYGRYADPSTYAGRRLTKVLTLSSFIGQLQKGNSRAETPYLANMELPERATKLLTLTPPPYFPITAFRRPRLWYGPTGAITPLHKDGSDNFALHLFGRKRWILFPVRDYPFLYMTERNPFAVPGFTCSEVDFRKPDLERFPLYRLAHPIAVEVNAGETLYLPAGWSHGVETLGTTLMVNYWVHNHVRLPAYLETTGR